MAASLTILAARQDAAFWKAHPGISDTPWEFQPPARFFEQLLNGPGYYVPFPFFYYSNGHADFARLPGIALFWMWIGWALDRRLRGVRSPVIRSRSRRVTSYLALFGLASFFAWRYFTNMRLTWPFPSMLPWQVLKAIAANPFYLHYSLLGMYVGLAWAVSYAIYFVWKLIATLRS
jgi:hypothetical protein